jgi:predicted ester cyclase
MKYDLKSLHQQIVENFFVSVELFDPDYAHRDTLLPVGVITGRDNYLAAGRATREAFPDMASRALEVICEGDTTVARWENTGTHLGEYNGIPATGNKVTYMGMTMYHWKDGRVIEGWTLFEYTHRHRQMGDDR